MRNFLASIAILTAILTAVSFLHGQGGIAPKPRPFKPPRIAVVDMAKVFEDYQKKKDLESELKKEADAEEKWKQEQKEISEKLKNKRKNIQPWSDRHKEVSMKIVDLDYEIEKREREFSQKFPEKKYSLIRKIAQEIQGQVKKYAESMEIDLVIEMNLPSPKGEDSPHWPIVHYVKPELEITDDIVKLLNASYANQ